MNARPMIPPAQAPMSHWHLDKQVSLTLVIPLVVQTLGGIWWAAGVSGRLDALEQKVTTLSTYSERLVRMEARQENDSAGIAEIKGALRSMSPMRLGVPPQISQEPLKQSTSVPKTDLHTQARAQKAAAHRAMSRPRPGMTAWEWWTR